jgi:hypothetical protein
MAESFASQQIMLTACEKTIDRLHERLGKERLKRIDLKIEIGILLDLLKQHKHLDEVMDFYD